MMWRIYYDDGSTFSETDGTAEQAPARGVIAILQPDPDPVVRQHVVSRFDYYWITDAGEWYGGDIFGLFDYLITPGWKTVKFGRTISNAEHRAIVARATADRKEAMG